MLETSLEIINPLGIHARAAAKLVGVTKAFASDVSLGKADKFVDGKSIMSVLLLGAPVGTTITVRVEGSDEDAAFKAVCDLVNGGFGEL